MSETGTADKLRMIGGPFAGKWRDHERGDILHIPIYGQMHGRPQSEDSAPAGIRKATYRLVTISFSVGQPVAFYVHEDITDRDALLRLIDSYQP